MNNIVLVLLIQHVSIGTHKVLNLVLISSKYQQTESGEKPKEINKMKLRTYRIYACLTHNIIIELIIHKFSIKQLCFQRNWRLILKKNGNVRKWKYN